MCDFCVDKIEIIVFIVFLLNEMHLKVLNKTLICSAYMFFFAPNANKVACKVMLLLDAIVKPTYNI